MQTWCELRENIHAQVADPHQCTPSCDAVHTSALLCVADFSVQCLAGGPAHADAGGALDAKHVEPNMAVKVWRRCPAGLSSAGLRLGLGVPSVRCGATKGSKPGAVPVQSRESKTEQPVP